MSKVIDVPAFPTSDHWYKGLTTRDCIAIQAMASLILERERIESRHRDEGGSLTSVIARMSYEQANDMMAEKMRMGE